MKNPLRDYELEHIARLLEFAANQFINHGCNDYRLKSTEANQELVVAFRRSNEESEEDVKHGLDADLLYVQDNWLMDFLAKRCREAMGDQARAAQQVGPDLN